MNKDAAAIKALTELGLRPEHELTPEEEELFTNATDPDDEYLSALERIFTDEGC